MIKPSALQSGYASLLVAVLFIGSLQLMGIGVLGEYIARIYMESKGRPTYLIRKHHEYRNTAAVPATEQPVHRPPRTIGVV